MDNFLKRMWSSKGDVSCKRVNGTVGFIAMLLITFFIVLKRIDPTQNQLSLISTMVVTSAALIGLGLLESRTKKKTDE